MHATKNLVLALALLHFATAQEPAGQEPQKQEPGTQEQETKGEASTFTKEQLEQIAAPIALYPDALLAQALMAATYPLEIVEASRWMEKNRQLKGDQLDAALKDKTWDPSVKSLCSLPDVLKRLNDNLDWTQDLGDAFLGQKAELMDTVQILRRKALEAGNLKSSKEITVEEQAEKIIVIESADPQVVYVPVYYPTAVYGSWSYTTYYYPPLYPPPPPGGHFFSFAAGVAWGAAVWGDCNWGWGHADVDIDINRYNTFVGRTERPEHRQNVADRAKSGKWQHDATHRKGVGYRDPKFAQQLPANSGQSRISRDQARGFSPGAAQQPTAGTLPSTGTRPGEQPRTATRPSTGNASRPSTGTTSRPTASQRQTGTSSSSFSGSRSAKTDRAASQRGSTSRGSSGSRGAARSGGGGGRR